MTQKNTNCWYTEKENFANRVGRTIQTFFSEFIHGDLLVKLSYIIIGFANLCRGQIVKGLLYIAVEASYIYFMAVKGISMLEGLGTLGSKVRGWYFDETLGIDVMNENGDNSMLILLYGIIAIFITIVFLVIYFSCVKAAVEAENTYQSGKKISNIIEDIRTYKDEKFHRTLLCLPIIGIILFTIIPLTYMILLAFTNYDKDHQVPANLFTWVGIKNFKVMLSSGSILSKTFWPVLSWTIVWAIFATFLNYFLGIVIALMINKKGIKFKKFYRAMFVISIAIPQFVSLLIMKNILQPTGTLNILLKSMGLIDNPLPFLTDPIWAKVTIIIVNLWIGIPYTLIIITGILGNIPDDLYESARIDGASSFHMFRKITMPYVMFVTAPYLITQFIGNINNFNVIYFLTLGNPSTLDYYQAGKTDLLVTWLYKLTVNSRDYCYASVIGIVVFIISATLSIFAFTKTASYKGEGDFS